MLVFDFLRGKHPFYGVVNQDLFDCLGGKRRCCGVNQVFLIRLD